MNYSTDNGGYYYIDEVGVARHFKIKNGGKVIIGIEITQEAMQN